jgi:hypothetical protein
MELRITEALKPFVCHGVNFKYESGGQYVGDCPLCMKGSHFYVNKATGQWDCKICGETGNVFTFLGKIAQLTHEDTSNESFEKLSNERGLPVAALRAWRLGWDGAHWLLPAVSGKKTTRDIRRYDPKTGKVMSTSGCHNQLYGEYKARQLSAGGTLWLCEGEWDTIAWSYVLGQCGYEDQRAVGAPGATIFKDEWVEIFKDRQVILCYDHDDAGRAGMKKAFEKLKGVATSLQILQWPADRPEGYDVRDFYKHHHKQQKKAKTIYTLMSELLVSPSEVTSLKHMADKDSMAGQHLVLTHPPNFGEVLKVYEKFLIMDEEMTTALKICFATVYTEQMEGDPLWVYLIGPPGAGKTALLTSMMQSDRCKFYSSISPHALVSGFNVLPDPSLLPVFNGYCVVCKDFTEFWCIPVQNKAEIFATLRGAYDGHVSKSFGNKVKREYVNLHFSILAGMTPVIHGDTQALLGERFLQYEMKKGVGWRVDKEIRKLLTDETSKSEVAEEVQKIASRFLAVNIKRFGLAVVPEWALQRLISLSQVLARMRGHVDREQYGEREMKYQASHEAGTRIAIQAKKLLMGLCVVDRTHRVTYEQYALMEKILVDSMNPIFKEILYFILEARGMEVTQADMHPLFRKLSRPTIARRLEDMYHLGILNKIRKSVGKTGPAPTWWQVNEKFLELWKEARIGYKLILAKTHKPPVQGVGAKNLKIVR